jgi:hypothetical protein
MGADSCVDDGEDGSGWSWVLSESTVEAAGIVAIFDASTGLIAVAGVGE